MRNNVILEIENTDISELNKLIQETFNNNISIAEMSHLYKILKGDNSIHNLGYYINDKLVGFLTLKIDTLVTGKVAIIWDVAVFEIYRRKGIATKLMLKAEEIVKQEKNINKIWLFSGFKRTSAHGLYRKLGYDEYRDKAFVKIIDIV